MTLEFWFQEAACYELFLAVTPDSEADFWTTKRDKALANAIGFASR